MSLSNLIEEMETLAKAQQLPDDPDGDQDDQDIAAAAEAANADNADQEAGAPAENFDEDDAADVDEEAEAEVVKSFRFTLEDGSEAEAFDATELIKALHEDLTGLRAESEQALGMAIDLIKSQSVEIATLKKSLHSLGSTGRGRKASVVVTEKVVPTATLAKSSNGDGSDGFSKQEFFAKAELAQKAGRITAADVSVAEAYLNKGQPVPDRIVHRVLGD